MSPILTSKQSLFLSNCSLVLIFFKLHFSPWVFFTALVQMPRKQIPVQVSHFHWSRGHMAAYIRPVTVPVREVHRISATSQTTHKFLSPFSWIKIVTNSERLKNKFTNPNRFRSKIEPKSMEFLWSSQRFDWIFIIKLWFLQFKRQIHRQKQRIWRDHRNPKVEKKKRERISKILNRLRRRKTKSWFISGFPARISKNRIKSKGF